MNKLNKNNHEKTVQLIRTWNNYKFLNSFAVISAFRLKKSDNLKQHAKLKKIVRAFGLSFEELIAGNVELGKKTVIKSLFISDIKRSDAVNLALHFNQKHILFMNEKGLSEIAIYEKSGYSRIVKTFAFSDDENNIEANLEVLRYYFVAKLLCKNHFAFLHKVNPGK